MRFVSAACACVVICAASAQAWANGQRLSAPSRSSQFAALPGAVAPIENEPAEMQEMLEAGEPPRLGAANAPVTIVIFGDFECSFCRHMSEMIEGQVLPHRKGDLNIIYRYFPLPQHPWAWEAAEMAECVKLQDREAFWKLSDFFYANQGALSISSIRLSVETFLVEQATINRKNFDECLDNQVAAKQVDRDVQLALSLGIHTTPTIFVNGKRLQGIHNSQQVDDAVNAALMAKY